MVLRTLLIDADIFIFRIATALETGFEWEPGKWSVTADAEEGMRKLGEKFEFFRDHLKADRMVLAMKDKDNWRRGVLPSYKANRTARDPLIRRALMDHCLAGYEVFSRPTLEGDDVLGILATSKVIIKGEKIIVSIDKDMKTIPGLSWNPDKPELGVVETPEVEADFAHMRQTLTGDRTDNYAGCPGVGPVKAEKILVDAWGGVKSDEVIAKGPLYSHWLAVLATYAKAGKTPEDALTMARVARICRASDYNFSKKEVILWQPPN